MAKASTRLLVYAGLAVGAGAAAIALVSGPPKIRPGMRVFLLGDSLAVGLGRPMSLLARDGKVGFDSMAKEGTRIDQWAKNEALFQKLTAFRPDLILVSLGTNDEYLQLDAGARQAAPLSELLTRLRAKAPVVWIGPPTLPKQGTNGATALIRRNVPSSHYFPSQNLTIPRSPDKLHPTAGGYAGWAGAIWKWLT